MRTTLELPDALFKEVKTRAVQEGVTLKELLAAYIKAGLLHAKSSPPFPDYGKQSRPLPVAWEPIPGESPTPARSNAELYAVLEEEEEDKKHTFSLGQKAPQA
jgi:hypothetical protein